MAQQIKRHRQRFRSADTLLLFGWGFKKNYIKSQRGTSSVVNDERDVSRQDFFKYHIFLKCSPAYLCPVLHAELSNPPSVTASIFFRTQNASNL